MWLESRQLLSPYTPSRPFLCASRPSTACTSPEAPLPKRPTERVVPGQATGGVEVTSALLLTFWTT